MLPLCGTSWRCIVRDDLTVSATTPLWVPLTIAAGGLVTTLGAAVITQWLANRRERTARREQWGREDSVRWQEDRKQAYAEFLAALSAWDACIKTAGSEHSLALIHDRKTLRDNFKAKTP